MSFNVSILQYLGKISDGLLVLISIQYENEVFEATYFYNNFDEILTISQELEDLIKIPIEEHPNYIELMKLIESKVPRFDEAIEQVEQFDINKVLPKPN